MVLTGEDRVTTTHSIIARCIDDNRHRSQGDAGWNETVRNKKKDIFQRFLHMMAVEGFDASPQRLYEIYRDFSAEHIYAYFPDNCPTPNLNFLPYAHVCKGDSTHAKMAEFMAAQSALFLDNPPVQREEYLRKSYGSMLIIARDRLGRVATDEDKKKIEENKENEEPNVNRISPPVLSDETEANNLINAGRDAPASSDDDVGVPVVLEMPALNDRNE